MRIIISSKYLKKSIKKALKSFPKEVEITPEKIVFHCVHKSIEVELSQSSVKDPERFENIFFDFRQWQRISKYLKFLPHQPIVCVFDPKDDITQIRIEIKHAEAVF